MVALPQVEISNTQIPSSLPKGLVAVFIGATNGIGETTLRQFARFTKGLQPKVIFVGRAQDAGDRIAKECKALNPEGEFTFMKADVGLIKGVDEVCGRIRGNVRAINLLFMSQGTLQTGVGECSCRLRCEESRELMSMNRHRGRPSPSFRRCWIWTNAIPGQSPTSPAERDWSTPRRQLLRWRQRRADRLQQHPRSWSGSIEDDRVPRAWCFDGHAYDGTLREDVSYRLIHP